MARSPLTSLPALLAGLLAVVGALLAWRHRRRTRATGGRVSASGPAPGGARTDDGLLLHVEEDGDPAAPVTVVFCHGFTAHLGEFVLQRETLRTRARLVLYDQRGHGRSPLGAPENATTEQLGRDLAAVIAQRVPRGPVVLVGHSMGGITLMTFARQHPDVVRERVAGAFLLATSADDLASSGLSGAVVRAGRRLHLLPVWLRSFQRSSPLLERGRRRGTRAGYRMIERLLFSREDAEPALVRMVQNMLEATPLTTVAALYPSLLDHDERAALPVLAQVPTTVLVGDGDRLTPVAQSRRLAAALGPDCRLVVVPGAGHSVNITRQELVDDALLELLDRSGAQQGVA